MFLPLNAKKKRITKLLKKNKRMVLSYFSILSLHDKQSKLDKMMELYD